MGNISKAERERRAALASQEGKEGAEPVAVEDSQPDAEKQVTEQAEVKPVAHKDIGLVNVTKNGEFLDIHPTTLKAHQSLGWAIAKE